MKLVRIIKMCLNETANRVRVGKHLFDMYSIKMVWTKSCFIAIVFQLYFRIRHNGGSDKPGDLVIKWHTPASSLCWCHILGGSVHSGKKNREASVVASMWTAVEVNAERTKYIAVLEIRMQDKVTI